MDRRAFLRGLLGGAAAVAAPERVYSFIWSTPTIHLPFFGVDRAAFPQRLSGIAVPHYVDFNKMLKAVYSAERMSAVLDRESPFLQLIKK